MTGLTAQRHADAEQESQKRAEQVEEKGRQDEDDGQVQVGSVTFESLDMRVLVGQDDEAGRDGYERQKAEDELLGMNHPSTTKELRYCPIHQT